MVSDETHPPVHLSWWMLGCLGLLLVVVLGFSLWSISGTTTPSEVTNAPTMKLVLPTPPPLTLPPSPTVDPSPTSPPTIPPPNTVPTEATTPELATPPIEPFPAEYIRSVVWPPVISTSDVRNDGCNARTDHEVRAANIDDATYCVYETTEGAAGSLYQTYTYETRNTYPSISATFTLRFPNCGAFDEPQAENCRVEQASLNPDALAHRAITDFKQRTN